MKIIQINVKYYNLAECNQKIGVNQNRYTKEWKKISKYEVPQNNCYLLKCF